MTAASWPWVESWIMSPRAAFQPLLQSGETLGIKRSRPFIIARMTMPNGSPGFEDRGRHRVGTGDADDARAFGGIENGGSYRSKNTVSASPCM